MDKRNGTRPFPVLSDLLDGAHLVAPDLIHEVIAAAAARIGWTADVYLVDYAQRRLVPMERRPAPPAIDVDGTLAGRAYRNLVTVVSNTDEPRLWVPLIDGVERLGVLELLFPDGTALDDPEICDEVRWFAHLSGHLLAGKSPYCDTFHRLREAQRRTVASELVWSLLPPLTMACDGLVIAGSLEPADAVAGDVFDYAVDDEVAHVAIVDAVGHDIRSGVIGALTLAAYRNGRRRSLDLETAMRQVDAVLMDFEVDTFATGIFGQLDLVSGRFTYLNAGHPPPLLLRNGKVVRSLEGGRRIILGMDGGRPETGEEQLERGDWLVLYTDGVTEARDEARAFFGLDRFVDILERCAAGGQSAPETLRRITHSVLEHQHGVLQDDATILVVQWATGQERRLTATSSGVAPNRGAGR